ncbi:MAG: serpin family protein, partial [Myxococcales bacterium]|nr:serpin family protein [Myxococcales bacterium]
GSSPTPTPSTPAPSASEPAPRASAEPPAPTTSATPSAPPKPEEVEAAGRFAKASNAFGFDLYRQVRQEPGNLAMSPASMSIALAMTWAGAKGETAAEMKKVLRFSASPADTMADAGKLTRLLENPSRPLKLSIANRLFGEKSYAFEKPYLDSVEKAFGAGLEPVDFVAAKEKARLTINSWVEKKTEKRIVDLVPKNAVSADSRLFLVNAVYFLADWQQPFDKESTRPADFSVSKSSKVRAPTMHQLSSFKLADVGGTKVLELPYKGGEMSMLLALPADADGIDALEKSLTPEKVADWQKQLKMELVEVSLPKFEIAPAAAMSLGETLQKLGMSTAFDQVKADFTAIANPTDKTQRLFISQVLHKAFVKVDEKGTEAAAASAVGMEAGGVPVRTAEFRADHPFVYMIRDNKSGLVLFIGRVADPTSK